MDRVVLTGGTGFIGSWLVEELISHEVEVVVLVRDLARAREKLKSDSNYIQLV